MYIIGKKTLFFDIHQNRSSADIFPHSMRANIKYKRMMIYSHMREYLHLFSHSRFF